MGLPSPDFAPDLENKSPTQTDESACNLSENRIMSLHGGGCPRREPPESSLEAGVPHKIKGRRPLLCRGIFSVTAEARGHLPQLRYLTVSRLCIELYRILGLKWQILRRKPISTDCA